MSDEAPQLGLFSAKYMKWLFGVLFVVIVAVQGYVLWDEANPFNERPFDSETWRMYAESEVPDSPRGKMTEGVIGDILPGLSREEVLVELGPPDAIHGSESFSTTPDGTLRYYLGMWSGNRAHEDWLEISFDTDGQFTHAEIVHP